MEALSYCQLMERCLAAEARVVELTAENVAIHEQSEEVYAAGYNHGHLNAVDGIAYADCVKDEFYSLALQVMAEVETPATDCIVAGIKADAVEEVLKIMGGFSSDECGDSVYFDVRDLAQQLRESTK